MKKVIYQKSTKTWRVMPENYLLYGLLGWGDNTVTPYTDHAIKLADLKLLKKQIPKEIYFKVKKVINNR